MDNLKESLRQRVIGSDGSFVFTLQALEAAEPVELTSSKTAHDATPGGADPSIETTLRTQARLLSAAMKLKESAQQEQLRRIQVGPGLVLSFPIKCLL